MNRSTLVSVCAATLLLACTERSSSPSAPVDASPTPPATKTPAPSAAAAPEDSGPPPSEVKCSAKALPPKPPSAAVPPLPPPVETMRENIIAAARACDYARLAKLVDENGKGVRFTFGEGTDAVAYWKEEEARDVPVLARIAQVLELPYAQEGDLYYWPSVHITGLKSAKDWKPLVGIYPEAQLKAMQKDNGSYLGLRVGINKAGDWQLAVAGD
ncbi:hypothetical protein NVS55_27930 [Myxococcus stipitatus]|uniref:hypothetical protein n=1 Tax=Myxococcus stipitatus TaxID=83455 RepID=UPI003145256A